MARERLYIIDISITILIVLVILGHYSFPLCPRWYFSIHKWIYSFHMGAFFFISGFLVKYTYSPLPSWSGYAVYAGKKILKFGIPYIVLGCLLNFYSIYASDGTFRDYLFSLKQFFLDPLSSEVQYLWFVYILLMFYLIAPLLCQFYRYAVIPCLFSAVWLFYHPLGRLFSMHVFSKYFLFFCSGVILCRSTKYLYKIPSWVSGLFVIPFVLFGVWRLEGTTGSLIYHFLSIPVLFFFSYLFSVMIKRSKTIELISRNSFNIYLYQMIILHLWYILFKIFPRTDFIFILFLLTGIPVAITGSIVLARILKQIQIIFTERLCRK